MKRILSSNAAVLFLLAALAQAQPGASPSSLSISAPQDYILAARGMQLSVRALNSRGAVLRGRSYSWQVSDANIAAIDGSGRLAGLSPGPVDVKVSDNDSSTSATRRFYIYPAAVTIDSGGGAVQAGDTLKLSAQAKDADGKTIPGVPFQWFSELPALARISADGMVTGVAEGRVTISAALDMGPERPGYSAFLSLQVLRRAAYKLKTLVSSDPAAQGATMLVPVRVAVAGNYVAALTSLSNGGQALVLWQSGRLQTLAVTGSAINGKTVSRFESLTVNSQGDVAVIADAQAEWCNQIFALFPAGRRLRLSSMTRPGAAIVFLPPTPSTGSGT
jgi:hypothetical protein